jgi:regulator of replication initiation timing
LVFYCFTENRKLRSNNKRLQEELVEWQDKYSDLQRETERLQGEIQFLMTINQEFSDENDKLKKEVGEAKRQKIDHKTKKAGKMPIRQTESDTVNSLYSHLRYSHITLYSHLSLVSQIFHI